MDERPDQRDQPTPSSTNTGGNQPAPSVNAPPPLTPYPQTFPTLPGQDAPTYPTAPGYPLPYGMTTYGQQAPLDPSHMPAMKKEKGRLGRPFPLPLSLFLAFGCVVLLALVAGARVLFGGDWAEAAAAAGVVALAVAVVTLLTALLRVAAGRRSLGFALLTLLLLVVLLGSGVAGLISSTPLHLAQAKALETSGQWSDAIREYNQAGQKGPNAPDIARLQNTWGEQLLKQDNYRGALTHFQTVLDDYQQSGSEVARARKNQFLAYATWMKSDAAHVPYAEAIAVFANYPSSPECDSACLATAAEVAPQAYYLYGMQLVQQKRYQLAITEFGKLATQYGSSPYAKQAHAPAATAYLAYGKQQIANQNCSGAVTTYQTLVANYKDTPEATTAQAALKAPQDVTGFITNAPSNPLPTVHLSKRMNWNTFFFSNEYSTSIDPKTGAFTFKQVAQGKYYVTTSRRIPGAIDYVTWTDASNGFFSFTVTPLCTMQLGTFDYSK